MESMQEGQWQKERHHPLLKGRHLSLLKGGNSYGRVMSTEI